MDARRVVTGHDADGKAVFVSDELVAPVTLALLPGSEFHQIWGSDTTAVVSRRRVAADARSTTSRRSVGSASGSSPSRPTAAPARRADLDVAAAFAEFDEKLPGHGASTSSWTTPACTRPRRSTTASCSRARSTLELDDGAKVVLHAGDTYVQNGTRHRWSNPGDVPAVLAVTLIGAHHRNVG